MCCRDVVAMTSKPKAHMSLDVSRRMVCHGFSCGESGLKKHLATYEKPKGAVRATQRQAQGRLLIDELEIEKKGTI